MRILAIETSCDETAVAVVEAVGDAENASFEVLGNALLSQVEAHKPYGGVYPNLAKREHAKNLVPLLRAALEEAEMLREDTQALPHETHDAITALLAREPGLDEALLEFLSETERPAIDVIAVTAGPGLEPALWVGINFAKALALAWGKPLVAVNHMEGHVFAALAREAGTGAFDISGTGLPVVALLISGGHTELVLMKEWFGYELIGQTRDDAVGEAFDKVARLLGLPYPGGPEISKLAERERGSGPDRRRVGTLSERVENQGRNALILPRPMLHEASCDFSFSGLKTAVRYLLRDMGALSDEQKGAIARKFEDAVAEVLWKKTARALEETDAKTLAIGGGVSANAHIRRVFAESVARDFPALALRIPTAALTTDNALMIAMAGYYHAFAKDFADPATLRANGNLRLG